MVKFLGELIAWIIVSSPVWLGILVFIKERRKKKTQKKVDENSTLYDEKKYHYDISNLNDIFVTDFENFKPEDYNKGKRDENNGNPFRDYYKEFDSEEAGVFRYLKVREFETGGKNFNFYTYKPNKYHRDHLRRLVVKLHSLYGKDDNGRGIYNEDDEQAMNEDDFWIGRTYIENRTHKKSKLGYDEEYGLNMTIWS